MTETKKLLPMGSVVLLREGLQKLVVIGRGVVYKDQASGADAFADYMAASYPSGTNPKTTIFFNHEDIDKVVFKGYSDDEEERFLEIYDEWKKGLDIFKEKEENLAEQTFGF